MAITTLEIAWLSGLVEGEGCISSRNGSPGIRTSMTDVDIVRRIATLWGSNVTGPYKPRGNQTKEVWTVNVSGYRAIGWIMMIYRFLGERRRCRALDVISKWQAAAGFARKVRGADGKTLPAICHPDRPLHARQKCRECYHSEYMKAWRRKTGRNGTFYRRRANA